MPEFVRRALKAALVAVLLGCPLFAVQAQTYTARPVRLIVPYPAGGTTDVLARRTAEALRARAHRRTSSTASIPRSTPSSPPLKCRSRCEMTPRCPAT